MTWTKINYWSKENFCQLTLSLINPVYFSFSPTNGKFIQCLISQTDKKVSYGCLFLIYFLLASLSLSLFLSLSLSFTPSRSKIHEYTHSLTSVRPKLRSLSPSLCLSPTLSDSNSQWMHPSVICIKYTLLLLSLSLSLSFSLSLSLPLSPEPSKVISPYYRLLSAA